LVLFRALVVLNGGQKLTEYNRWCYTTPILGAVVADQYLGRFDTIAYASATYICGLFLLCISATDFIARHGLAFPGLVLALLIIGLAAGGIKANVTSLVAEQYSPSSSSSSKPTVKTLKSGERVIIDRDLTIQRYVASSNMTETYMLS
jgi:dipeptide/tripeptide permease